MDVLDRAGVGLDAVPVDEAQEEVVLAGGDGLDEVFLDWHVLGLEDRADAVGPWLAVDVGVVVVGELEGDVELVEDLLPRLGVDGRRLSDDAVEVEEAGGDVGGEAQVVRLAHDVNKTRGCTGELPETAGSPGFRRLELPGTA